MIEIDQDHLNHKSESFAEQKKKTVRLVEEYNDSILSLRMKKPRLEKENGDIDTKTDLQITSRCSNCMRVDKFEPRQDEIDRGLIIKYSGRCALQEEE